MSDEIETIDKNPKSCAAWKREAERLQAIIDSMALAAIDSKPFAYIIQDKYERERGVEGHLSRSHVSKYVSQEDINEHEITCTPLYRHAQQPVVDADDNFYSWFGREWQENYQHNQYTTAAKQMLGVMAESAWKAGRRAAMLSAAPQEVKGE